MAIYGLIIFFNIELYSSFTASPLISPLVTLLWVNIGGVGLPPVETGVGSVAEHLHSIPSEVMVCPHNPVVWPSNPIVKPNVHIIVSREGVLISKNSRTTTMVGIPIAYK